ncbi:hypothetical protein DDE18_00575 [Nocardioides gansuensis]|uniref:Uncharacterized protein n=1 Tax=Nocardioides gansuensis TaxID=2138300 RepID=A0A2T8FEP8_9ACTN|nr:hypothetical protein [Nocardioides gansuensis]PVG84173.1 hypothetical protein DDE18_00575 [Nocardioides gansuensis]
MAIATAILLVLIFAGAVLAVGWGLRSYNARESATDARLHSTGTPTVTYAVPLGVDPAVIEAALAHAGFTSMLDRVAPAPSLIIECDPEDRELVRGLIEDVYVKEYGASGLSLGPATFQDEPR